LQSLSLLNSDFVVARASKLAQRLELECLEEDCPDARVSRAYVLAVGRFPDDLERAAARCFLQAQPARYPKLAPADARRRAWVDFCQMVLASNAFLYVE
jgi:hypothetical protein